MVIPDDFIEALSYLPEGERAGVIVQVIEFVQTGAEPRLDGAAMGMFIAARRTILKANAQSSGGRKGGSAAPRRLADGNPGQASTGDGRGSLPKVDERYLDKGTSDEPCGELNRTEQNRTEQNGTGERAHAGGGYGCEIPTIDEVRAHFAANCLRGNPDAYWADRDAAGWRKRGEPIANWRSDAMGWSYREPEFEQMRADRAARSAARGQPADAHGPKFERVKSAREQLAEFEAVAGGAK